MRSIIYLIIIKILSINAYAMESSTDTAQTAEVKNLCAVCQVECKKKCASCGVVYYCSVEHQHEHWHKEHKTACKELQKLYESTKKAIEQTGSLIEASLSLHLATHKDSEVVKAINHKWREEMKLLDMSDSVGFLANVFKLMLELHTPSNAYAYAWLVRAGYDQRVDENAIRSRLEDELNISLDPSSWLFAILEHENMEPINFIKRIDSAQQHGSKKRLELSNNFDNDKLAENSILKLLSHTIAPNNKDIQCLALMLQVIWPDMISVILDNINIIYTEYERLKSRAAENLINKLRLYINGIAYNQKA